MTGWAWTWALGLLNVTAMYLALHRRRAQAAALSLALQVPWTAYDIATRQYGLLLITAGSLATCAPVLWRCIASRRRPRLRKAARTARASHAAPDDNGSTPC